MIALVVLSATNPTRAQSSHYDYVKVVAGWTIEGYAAGPVTCGAVTKPEISEAGYFSLYHQLYQEDSGQKISFWNIDLGTSIPVGVETSATFQVDDKLSFKFPSKITSSSTVNPQRPVVSFDSEDCLFQNGCEIRSGNLLLTALASVLKNAKVLTIHLVFKSGVETHKITVASLGQVLNGVDACLETLSKSNF